MKNLILILFLIFAACPILINAQAIRIPDPAFREKLIALGYDENDNGKIEISEAKEVTKLSLENSGIINLEGINSFTNLEVLNVGGNKITKLDVSKLKKLTGLYAYDNPLNEVNVTGLTKLADLRINNNGGKFGIERSFVRTLNLAGLTSLEVLWVQRNRLTELDVSGLNNLKEIRAEGNLLEKVALTKSPNLKFVKLDNNPLKITVDIRGLVYLEYFNCEKCELLFLNMSGTVSLKELYW